MFPPMTPLTERVRIEFANCPSEQQTPECPRPTSFRPPDRLHAGDVSAGENLRYPFVQPGTARRFYSDRLV
jgi:hypothetical protein